MHSVLNCDAFAIAVLAVYLQQRTLSLMPPVYLISTEGTKLLQILDPSSSPLTVDLGRVFFEFLTGLVVGTFSL